MVHNYAIPIPWVPKNNSEKATNASLEHAEVLTEGRTS